MADISDTLKRDIMSVEGNATATFTAIRAAGSTVYTVLNAVAEEVDNEEIMASGGLFQVGDKKFYLDADQITVTADSPNEGDTLVFAGLAYKIVDADLDALGVLWNVVGRRSR